ncbi:DUF58 domain-containing protein [Candidatus Woesearchaeota archaeon]|nr:DUF58 domain-containing protein [Candidatus Woesearchaeota archaeon]
MIDAAFLNQINRFDLIMKKKVLSQYSGERLSTNTGEGLVFSDFRQYIPGDDFRQIDWSLYARTEDYFIKRFEEERNMTLHILLDASASMDFGGKITKYEYAAMIGLGFCYLSLKNNEKFDFSTFADKMEYIKAKKGKNTLIEILDFLNKKKVVGKSNFYESLAAFKNRLKSKSMVVLISDFLFDPVELEQSLKLFKRSELYVVQVLDQEELKFNMAGDFMLKDSEHGNVIKTFISNRLRSVYRNKLDVHNATLKKMCGDIGAKFITVTTDTPIFDTFYKVLR